MNPYHPRIGPEVVSPMSYAPDSAATLARNRSFRPVFRLLRWAACRLLILAMLAGIVSTIAARPRLVADVTTVQTGPHRLGTAGETTPIVEQATGE
jgi:hypothetical protein